MPTPYKTKENKSLGGLGNVYYGLNCLHALEINLIINMNCSEQICYVNYFPTIVWWCIYVMFTVD